jgi:hypothetical protein
MRRVAGLVFKFRGDVGEVPGEATDRRVGVSGHGAAPVSGSLPRHTRDACRSGHGGLGTHQLPRIDVPARGPPALDLGRRRRRLVNGSFGIVTLVLDLAHALYERGMTSYQLVEAGRRGTGRIAKGHFLEHVGYLSDPGYTWPPPEWELSRVPHGYASCHRRDL